MGSRACRILKYWFCCTSWIRASQMLESLISHAALQNSFLTWIHTRHTEEQLVDVQIYSEAVSLCILHLKVFTVPWWRWRAFCHGLSTSSCTVSPCPTSPLRCRRTTSASLWRRWKALLAAICLRYLMSLTGPNLSLTRYFKREESNESFWEDHFLYMTSITHVAASSQSSQPFCSPSSSAYHLSVTSGRYTAALLDISLCPGLSPGQISR